MIAAHAQLRLARVLPAAGPGRIVGMPTAVTAPHVELRREDGCCSEQVEDHEDLVTVVVGAQAWSTRPSAAPYVMILVLAAPMALVALPFAVIELVTSSRKKYSLARGKTHLSGE
ncbi:hypothetical protein [Streptomyces sp. SM13]|uniref:hypothetical protein n=1 Tax=Streptomyces sp. SM13 TaxID=1983803 RepID=UPI0015E1788F|nr:hypothetical protein [Streptomyces sp. SM13]